MCATLTNSLRYCAAWGVTALQFIGSPASLKETPNYDDKR